jgi:bifunctional non-homologous end joining protein LigD
VALMEQNGKYAGSAFITLPTEVRERLWKRVQKAKAAPVAVPKTMTNVEWVTPGIKARVKHLRGDAKLRHASLQDFREAD